MTTGRFCGTCGEPLSEHAQDPVDKKTRQKVASILTLRHPAEASQMARNLSRTCPVVYEDGVWRTRRRARPETLKKVDYVGSSVVINRAKAMADKVRNRKRRGR